MSGELLKEKVCLLQIAPASGYAFLQSLIIEGFFDQSVSSVQVVHRIKEVFGKRWKTVIVHTYMKRFMTERIIAAIKLPGLRQNFWVLASVSRDEAIRSIRKIGQIREIEEQLFSAKLVAQLKKNFSVEVRELQENFGRNGNATAFLLRKILEKLIVVVFSKNGKQTLLEDGARPGGYKGLKDMIEISAREKVHGLPFITPKTANEIKGLKFLGDVAAHNPLTSVETSSILPQMPFMITAYEELAARL